MWLARVHMCQPANLISNPSAGKELALCLTDVRWHIFPMKLENVTTTCHTFGNVTKDHGESCEIQCAQGANQKEEERRPHGTSCLAISCKTNGPWHWKTNVNVKTLPPSLPQWSTKRRLSKWNGCKKIHWMLSKYNYTILIHEKDWLHVRMGYQKKGYTSSEITTAWIEDWDKLTKEKANGQSDSLSLMDTIHISQWDSLTMHTTTR